MSGDATKILSRRADAPTLHGNSRGGVQVLDDAPTVDASEWGWVDFGGTDVFDEEILKSPIVDETDIEFWGAERRQVLDAGSKRLIRQAAVVTAMVAVLAGLLWVADRSQLADQEGTVVAGNTSGAEATEQQASVDPGASTPRAAESGLRSSSAAAPAELGVEQAQALANAESAIVALAQGFDDPAAEAATTAPSTTVAPTTVPPTTAPPTTTPPTTPPTAAAPSAEAVIEADETAPAPAASGSVSGDTEADAAAGGQSVEGGTESASATEPDATSETPPTTAHPEGWVDAGHGVFVPPVLLEIRYCESRHDYTAANPSSSARGAYQFLRGSWADYGHRDRYGVAEAHLATPAQQDEAALITWQRSGTRPWNASKHCWG